MPLSPFERKVALMRAKVTMQFIANALGVSQPHVSMVVSGQRRSKRIEEAIAGAIGKPVRAVFPPIEVRQSA